MLNSVPDNDVGLAEENVWLIQDCELLTFSEVNYIARGWPLLDGPKNPIKNVPNSGNVFTQGVLSTKKPKLNEWIRR